MSAVASATVATATLKPRAGQLCSPKKVPPKGFQCVKNKQGTYRLVVRATVVKACGATATSVAAACGPQKTVSGFIKALQIGDGVAACAFLTDAEQNLLVANAKDANPALNTSSCASVIQSFNAEIGAKSAALSGRISNVNFVGTRAGGMWVYVGTSGQQAVLLAKTSKGWLIDQSSNDFPTAVLHFFD